MSVEDLLILTDSLADRINFVFRRTVGVLGYRQGSEFHHRCRQEESGFRRRQVPALDRQVAGAFFGKAAAARSTDESIIDSVCCESIPPWFDETSVRRRDTPISVTLSRKLPQQTL